MLDFKQIEEEVLKFWKSKKIYEKAKKKNAKGKKFYFLQGPPYTSGKIHIGHAWNNSLKDMVLRYKRMNGLNVWDRAGYDMHGLPTENAVQKKLGFKTKEEIIKYGMDKFAKDCMNFSKEHAGYMNEDFKRLGIWMDFDDPYMPVTKDFISGQWMFFKKADEQGRLYQGNKVMHWDSESETSLAKHELEYKNITDTSIFLKFKKKDEKNTYFIIWTTTPWTIPFNLAIMVNPDVDYVKIDVEGEKEKWIIAKDLVGIFMNSIVEKKYKIVEEFKGDKLEGQEYEHFLKDEMPVYKKLKKKYPKLHTILLSKQYVNTQGGTGLVHCAPGCGPEDEEVGREYGIEGYNSLNEQGEFEDDSKFKGWVAKVDDEKFIEYFKKKGNLIATSIVEHEYPHSWRSHKPVVFRTTEQWFLKITDLVDKLLKFNKKVSWVPEKSRESYDRWTENLKDNSVARQRFWGCPIPIWVNEEDEKDYIVIGSVEELEKLTKKKFDDLTIHKPWIDKVIIEKNGKKYKRIVDVADVWLDSGTTSWNCLYNNPKLIKEYFPADFILEATEQTRLWFSLLQICSAIVFNKSSYKNVYTHGMIFDFQGTKMSKSLGNIVSPYEVIDKYSSDIFRYYICEITAGENISFNWEDVKQKQKNLVVLVNIENYIEDLIKQSKTDKKSKQKLGIEEKYILSKANSTIKKVTEYLKTYNLDKSIGEIEKLFLDLSRVYIKMTRDKASNDKTRGLVLGITSDVYIKCLKMFSIICPLVTDGLWQKLGKCRLLEKDGYKRDTEESVHLSDWPKFDKKLIDEKLEKEFDNALGIIENGLYQRDKEHIGLKWPLASAEIKIEGEISKELQEIIMGQLNIKAIEIAPGKELSVKLNTKMTPELEAEGYAREISRKVQALRKREGLVKSDKIKLGLNLDGKLAKMLENMLDFIKERVNAREVLINGKDEFDASSKDKIKGNEVEILFNKV